LTRKIRKRMKIRRKNIAFKASSSSKNKGKSKKEAYVVMKMQVTLMIKL
jgi:hypothetical protein